MRQRQPLTVTGSIIAPIVTLDKMGLRTPKFAASGGSKNESFEGARQIPKRQLPGQSRTGG
jgi:hypothetical protein